jgi:hypothetical protein
MNLFSEEFWKRLRETLGLRESLLGIYYTNDKSQGSRIDNNRRHCFEMYKGEISLLSRRSQPQFFPFSS